MKKIHKAIKLPLIYLTALAAFAVKANETTNVAASKPEAVVSTGPAVPAEKTPIEMAVEVFIPLLFDPKYQVKESFHSMCCRAITHLEKASGPGTDQIVEALKIACAKKHFKEVVQVLTSIADIVKKYSNNRTPLNKIVLATRLQAALNIK